MSSIRLARVFGALGVSGALAAGALSVGVSSASAATATSNYTCTTSVANPADPAHPTKLAPVAVPVSVTAPALKAKPGQKIAAVPTSASANVPAAAASQLAGLATLGDVVASVRLPLSIAGSAVPFMLNSSALTSTTQLSPLKMKGDLAGPFTVPSALKPGFYPVTLPKSFALNFVSSVAGGGVPTGVAQSVCSLTSGASRQFGWFTVLNHNGTTPAKPTAFGAAKFAHSTITTKQRAVANLAVRTTAGGGTPTGRVVALLKGKTVGSAPLKGGKATVKLGRLAKGSYTVTFKYLGSSTYKAVSKGLKLTVKKG